MTASAQHNRLSTEFVTPHGNANDLDKLPPVAVRVLSVPTEFHDVVADGVPVVLKGLLDEWPALAAGRSSANRLNAYLKAMDRGIHGPVMEAPASSGGRFGYAADMREFSFSKRQRNITETLDRIENLIGMADAPFVAIQMLPLATHLPDFVRENWMPLLPPQVTPRLWLGGAVRTQTHNDRDHNLVCMLAGRRRFVLFPPEQVGNLYVGPLDNPPPLSLVDPEVPDLTRFPRYSTAINAACVAQLAPGDVLFVPKYWWHHVTSRDLYNAMVNYWWGDTARGLENPNDVFLAALLALKDLPLSERNYWNAMFDTYVFGQNGERVNHIPEALRAALGPMQSASRAALKQQLKTAILKSP